MQLGHTLVRHLRILALVPLLALASSALAADLTLAPWLLADEDLHRVVPQEDGIGVMCAGQVDWIANPGDREVRVSAQTDQTVMLGDDGVTVGVITHREGAADYAPTASFELRDGTGKIVWALGATDDVTYAISRTGAVVGMSLNVNIAKHNTLHFYGPGGYLLAEVEVPYLLGGSYEPDGGMFFATTAVSGLHAFDVDGREAWHLLDARLFTAAPGGEHVAAVTGAGRLQLIRRGIGVALIDLGGLLVRRIAIAPDGSRVAVAGKHEIRVYSGSDLSLQWNTVLENKTLAFTSVDIAAEMGWLLAGVARDLGRSVPVEARHPEGEVRAYDASGQMLHSAHLEFPIWNIWTPTAILDRSGKAATITTRRAVYRTVLP